VLELMWLRFSLRSLYWRQRMKVSRTAVVREMVVIAQEIFWWMFPLCSVVVLVGFLVMKTGG
jgi:hypothetical protein